MSAPLESCTPAAPRASARFSPAVIALAIQGIAFLLTLLLVSVAGFFQWTFPLAVSALMQGGLAAWISRRKRLAPWWPPIQFFFPLAAIAVQGLQLPPVVFLAAFLLLLAIFWSTFKTQVPYYPSAQSLRSAVAALLPAGPVRFADVGSGLGGITLDLARRRPEGEFTGIEIAPLPWLISLLRARLTGNHARFLRGDYNALDFSRYDVVFAYLSPAAMPALWEKARAEMGRGSLLLSYEFHIPGVVPSFSGEPDDYGRCLHGWRM
ncbi:MAG: class I SAM-dependent methyltransferase [Burkholderiaceae bacterium]